MLRPGYRQHWGSLGEAIAFENRESETLKILLNLFAQSRAAADEIADAATETFMNRIESDGPKIEWRLISQPCVGLDHSLGSLTNPIAAFVEFVLDAAVKKFPQSRHANHASDVAILDCPGKGVAG